MASNCLIAKPNNNIYFKRNDETKTDLQSNEILAFAQILIDNHVFDNVHLLNDANTALANTNNTYAFTSVLKQYVAAHNMVDIKFDKHDTLIIFCGVWFDSNNISTLLELINDWPGKIYYLLNDLRLTMSPEIKAKLHTKNITVLTQALAYTDNTWPTKYIAMQYLPLYYNYDDTINDQKFDICYQYMNFKDNGTYRQRKLLELNCINSMSKLWIGPHNDMLAMNEFNTITGTVKHYDVRLFLKKCLATYIVSEELYIKHKLMPNRVYEALMLGVIPVFDRLTFKSIKTQFVDIADILERNFVLNDDFSNLHSIVFGNFQYKFMSMYRSKLIKRAVTTLEHTALINNIKQLFND